ncbi:MAG: peptidoglycan bridge formation glycyltransferase FemA/FemB family protein [Patescibacteria group bacterium]|jgi:lipid II:glycine glycyltransferase (peptidoglycan interpeptide bridge formation enzyme)
MKIINISEPQILNDLVGSDPSARFLQSWEWGEFQEKVGFKVFRLAAEEDGKLIAAATLIKKPFFFGKSYFYCPRGPIINFQFPCLAGRQAISNSQLFFNEVKKLADKENCIFLRFEPETKLKVEDCPEDSGLKIEKSLDVQPSKTIILDLLQSEDELLKNMHPKTRYNIRLAEKKGVKIREAEPKEFNDFWCLLDDTCERDGFRAHEDKYYDKMLSLGYNRKKGGKTSLNIKLFFAVYNSRVIAANIAGFFGDTATYIHGASGNEFRNVMAPYLLQWETIKLAKRLGYRYYDFYGIDEKKWPGVTRFKRGFGGREMDYPGTFDMIFDGTWYYAYKTFRKLRRMF